MKKLIVVCVLALSGCAGAPPAPSYVEVKVPIVVPCKTADIARPAFAVAGTACRAASAYRLRA